MSVALKHKSTHKIYSQEEYFSLEEKADCKHEYYQGEIVAMAGASLNHNWIVSNVHADLYNALKKTACNVFSTDLRLWIKKRDFYVYPDITVICGKPKLLLNRNDTITNPTVIIEVLSKSTQAYDRSDKFHAYWTLDSFKEYVLIDQYRVYVEYFKRVDEKLWEINILTKLDDVLSLQSVEANIPLSSIYQNVDWEEVSPPYENNN